MSDLGIENAGDLIDATAFREVPSFHIGAIDATATSSIGGWFAGWALEKATGTPAAAFVVKSDLGAVRFFPNKIRPDLVKEFGPKASLCGIEENLPLKIISEIFSSKIKYYALNREGIITELTVNRKNDLLSSVNIVTEGDFYRLIQTPSTRIGDIKSLTFVALHTLSRNSQNYVLSAACACVLGYRLLDGVEEASQKRDFITSEISRLLRSNPKIPRGLFIRWHTSLRLIAGYLAYQRGADTEALIHFQDISNFFIEIKKWPQALTNILIGIAITGFLFYEKAEIAAAVENWSKAEDVLRYGTSVAEFQNFYAYGELKNAVQVAQFAHTCALCAVRGGILNDTSLAPMGTTIDLRTIPGPMAKLTAERGNAQRPIRD